MKLYLTLKDDEGNEVDREVIIKDNEYNPHILEIIEDMQDTLTGRNCEHQCTSNCRREGCNCQCGNYCLKKII